MSKLHKALSESPNVLTAEQAKTQLREALSGPSLRMTKRGRKMFIEYATELVRASKLARESKRKRKGAK